MESPQDRVPQGCEGATRTRMVTVWEEGCKNFPSERVRKAWTSPASEIAWMALYASMTPHLEALGRSGIREKLWKLANSASHLLPPDFDVLGAALEEYGRAVEKHPGMTLECDGHTDATRLFALVEEIGEVAACLTYDNDAETGHGSDLESEVIQVVALALAWATRYLEDGE